MIFPSPQIATHLVSSLAISMASSNHAYIFAFSNKNKAIILFKFSHRATAQVLPRARKKTPFLSAPSCVETLRMTSPSTSSAVLQHVQCRERWARCRALPAAQQQPCGPPCQRHIEGHGAPGKGQRAGLRLGAAPDPVGPGSARLRARRRALRVSIRAAVARAAPPRPYSGPPALGRVVAGL